MRVLRVVTPHSPQPVEVVRLEVNVHPTEQLCDLGESIVGNDIDLRQRQFEVNRGDLVDLGVLGVVIVARFVLVREGRAAPSTKVPRKDVDVAAVDAAAKGKLLEPSAPFVAAMREGPAVQVSELDELGAVPIVVNEVPDPESARKHNQAKGDDVTPRTKN